MKKLLSLLLLCVSIIMPAQAQYTNISNTELFEIRASANVSPNQLERVKHACRVWGWVCNRSFHPFGAGVNKDKGLIFLDSQPNLGWTIAETNVSGPWGHPNGHPTIILPLRGTITWNSDNWNPIIDEFVYGQVSAFVVMMHEIGHVMGLTWPGSYNTQWGLANVADYNSWWGINGLVAYQQEFDASATFIPLYGDGWHVSETAMPWVTMSPILDSRLNYNPELLTRTEVHMLADLGYYIEPNFNTTSLALLFTRRGPLWQMTAPVYTP